MNKLTQQWMDAIEKYAPMWPERWLKKHWIKVAPIEDIVVDTIATTDVFRIHKYDSPNLKLSQLTKQYLDQESFAQAMVSKEDIVTVKLIGKKKDGAAAVLEHCLHHLDICRTTKTVVVHFRCSDIIKKWMTDIFYLQQKVLKPLGAIDYTIVCKFNEFMMRTPHWHIYLDEYANEFGEEALIERIEKRDVMTRSWISWYQRHRDEINFCSLEKLRRELLTSPYWHIYQNYIDKKSK